MCKNGVKSEAAGWEGARGVGREAYQQRPRQTYSTCPRGASSARPRGRRPEPPRRGTLAELWPSRSAHSLWPDELRKEGNGSATITPASRGLYPAGHHPADIEGTAEYWEPPPCKLCGSKLLPGRDGSYDFVAREFWCDWCAERETDEQERRWQRNQAMRASGRSTHTSHE